MIAMQYSVAPPADYDMEIIARRIRERGPAMNGFPGLDFKAFLLARKAGGGVPGAANLYAPFYLWRRAEGMAEFLSGPGFAALSGDFGRPVVKAWPIWHAATGGDLSRARFAECEMRLIAPGADLGALRADESRAAQAAVADGAIAAVAGFDPGAWTVLRFRLWRDLTAEGTANSQRYEVGHVAEG